MREAHVRPAGALGLSCRGRYPVEVAIHGFWQILGFCIKTNLLECAILHSKTRGIPSVLPALLPAAPTAYSSIHIGHPVHILCRMTVQRQQSANRQFGQLYRLDIE